MILILLYPSVMLNEFPLSSSVKSVPFPLLKFINMYEGVTECEVMTPKNMNIPLLPLRIDGKLKFPIGNFKGVWNNVELRKALSIGYKIRPIKQIIYTETFKPFDTFVNAFYNKRLEFKKENNAMELVMKLILNSLYGKFAQKEKQDLTINNMEYLDDDFKKKLLFSTEDNFS